MQRLLVLGCPTMRLVLRYISRIMLLDGLSDLVSKDITLGRETRSDSWPTCYVWLRIYPAEGMACLSYRSPSWRIFSSPLKLSDPSTNTWEQVIRKDKIFSVIGILFKFHQLHPRMWRGNRDYLLRLRFCVLGRSDTMVLRLAEGSACPWTSSAPWLRHQNAGQWRRDKCWYRDFSRRNVNTAWKTISIFCKILSFLLRSNLHKISQVSFGSYFWPSVPEYVDELIEALIEKKAPFVCWQLFFILYFMIQACYWIRFFLMRPQMLHYRSNTQKESNHQVWEWYLNGPHSNLF